MAFGTFTQVLLSAEWSVENLKFAICNELFEDWPFAKICRFARQTGYTGIEIAPFTLASLVTEFTPESRSEYLRIAREEGVEIVGLHWLLAKTTGFHLTSPERGIREKTAKYLEELARCCRDFGGSVLVFGSPAARNIPEGSSHEDAFRFAAETIRGICPILEESQVDFCLEPLSMAETNFLCSAAEAEALRAAIDHPRVKLHLDVKAMSSEEISIPEIIRRHCHQTRHFHANDPNRLGPGMGDVDFTPIFSALRAANYQGWVSVEVFDFSLGPEVIARKSFDYMQMCLEQATEIAKKEGRE